MTEVMISIPEQHAGVPVSIGEAIESLVSFDVVPGVKYLLTLGGEEDPRYTAWIFILSGFCAGVATYVQSPSNGRYARIPRSFWESWGHARDVPLLFPGVADAIGQSDDMIGQPIVLWDGSLAPTQELMLRMAAHKVKATASMIEQAVPIKGRRSRAETPEQKELHKFFAGLERVGHLEGGVWNIPYVAMQRKYQSNHGPCSLAWFKKWGKRFAEGDW